MSEGKTSPVYFGAADDPELARATAEAVGTFKYFWRELTWEHRRIVPALELSAIKVAFQDPGGRLEDVEHMWLSDVEFDGEELQATLLNAPNGLRSVKQGDRLTLPRAQIEDWMYASSGRVYGGFTVQALRAKMSKGERRGHDEAWGFDFGDPSQVALVPNWNANKQGVLGRLLGSDTPPPSDPDAEHPMSENMAPGLEEAVRKDPAAFFALGPTGLNLLHSLALGGSAACVKVLLAAGADPRQKTSRGRTALELAQALDWPRVVALLRTASAS